MTLKLNYYEIKEKLNEIRKIMLCTHPGFQNAVKVVHEDGSVMFFESAFVRIWEGWYLVLTEHQGYFPFHPDDVKIYEYKHIASEFKDWTQEEETQVRKEFEEYQKENMEWFKQQQLNALRIEVKE